MPKLFKSYGGDVRSIVGPPFKASIETISAHGVALWLVISPLCGGCLSSYAIGNHPEWRRVAALPEDYDLEAEAVFFPSLDGLWLSAWWLPAAEPARGTVILSHGQGGNRSVMLPRAAFLVRAGYSVLALDLRSHGESGGRYITAGYAEAWDVLGALQHVRNRGGIGPVILFGYSYGAVASLHAAARTTEPAAIIADAAFISATDVLQRVVGVARADDQTSWGKKLVVGLVRCPGFLWLVGVEFYLRTGVDVNGPHMDAIQAVTKLGEIPVLFLAGEHDPISPPANMRRLYDAAASPMKVLRIIPNATHDTYTAQTAAGYESAVLNFLATVTDPHSVAVRGERSDESCLHH